MEKEEPTAMDVEHRMTPQSSFSNPLSSIRFGLKNSVQTNFGDDYVFQISPEFDWSLVGVSLSSNVVKLYAPSTGQYYGECRRHSDSIHQISFSGPSGPSEVSRVSAGPSHEVFSFSFGGSGDYLLSAGCKSKILFWDWRNKKQVACLEDSHGDDVTQVLFVPQHQNKLISASLDGLICSYDTGGDIDDDDHLESVIVQHWLSLALLETESSPMPYQISSSKETAVWMTVRMT